MSVLSDPHRLLRPLQHPLLLPHLLHSCHTLTPLCSHHLNPSHRYHLSPSLHPAQKHLRTVQSAWTSSRHKNCRPHRAHAWLQACHKAGLLVDPRPCLAAWSGDVLPVHNLHRIRAPEADSIDPTAETLVNNLQPLQDAWDNALVNISRKQAKMQRLYAEQQLHGQDICNRSNHSRGCRDSCITFLSSYSTHSVQGTYQSPLAA